MHSSVDIIHKHPHKRTHIALTQAAFYYYYWTYETVCWGNKYFTSLANAKDSEWDEEMTEAMNSAIIKKMHTDDEVNFV